MVYEPKIFYFEFLCVANKKIDSSFSLFLRKSLRRPPQNKTKQEEEDEEEGILPHHIPIIIIIIRIIDVKRLKRIKR